MEPCALRFPLSESLCILHTNHARAPSSIVGSFGDCRAVPLHATVRRINVKGVEIGILLFFLTSVFPLYGYV